MIDTTVDQGALERPEDAGKGDPGKVARWMMEIDLSEKTERKWRQSARKAIERYRDEGERKDQQFNIYWANVETLRPMLYSTPPKLDVRRRFADADPVGKVAAEVMERAIQACMDAYDFDEEIDNIVLDYLLPSRGVARVRFEPTFDENMDEQGDSYETMTYAQTYIEHVAWDRFRHGPGITWKEVPWVGYEHQLTRDETDDKFPGFGQKVEYDISMDGIAKEKAESAPSVFKRVRIWEIWDKQKKKIYWMAPSYPSGFLLVEDDKLNLEGFFDCERPLYAVKTSTSLVPQVEYNMYRDQAKELDRVTLRIGKLVSTLKQRGIYDSTVTEFKELLKAADNEMIPTSTAAALMAAGGLEKGIWMMPMGEAAAVLKTLTEYREQVKQTIYEITGISDILRGSTDPNETLGAQQLKAQSGGKRVQRRQRDVQRLIRGLLRKKGEIIAENYTPELLALMTGVQLPYEAQKQAAQQQIQQQAAMQAQQAQQHQQMAPQQPGMPPQQQPLQPPQPSPIPPEVQQMLSLPSWEDVMKVLRNDMLRSFKIDIETDSTIAADQAADREAITELIQGIGGFIQQVGPAVEQGFISENAAKQVLLSCLRRFKFGSEAEDALENDHAQPQQQKPNPEMVKAQAQMELEKFKAQSQIQLAQATQEAQAKQDSQEQAQESQREAVKLKMENDLAVQKLMLEHKLELEKIRAQKDLELRNSRDEKNYELKGQGMKTPEESDAEMGVMAGAVKHLADSSAATSKAHMDMLSAHLHQSHRHNQIMAQKMDQHAEALGQMAHALTRPRKAVRDKAGKLIGSEVA